jgi:hypothetical protein
LFINDTTFDGDSPCCNIASACFNAASACFSNGDGHVSIFRLKSSAEVSGTIVVADICVPDAEFPVLEVPGKEVDPGGSGGPEATEKGGAPGGGGGGPEAIERGGAPGCGTEIASGRVGPGGKPAGSVE